MQPIKFKSIGKVCREKFYAIPLRKKYPQSYSGPYFATLGLNTERPWLWWLKGGVFSGPYFSVFRLNMEIYGVNIHIQSECRKIWTRKTPYLDIFHAVDSEINNWNSHYDSWFIKISKKSNNLIHLWLYKMIFENI